MKAPYFDLTAQYAELRGEIGAAIDRVCQNASFILEHEVAKFEQAFAAYCEVKHCVALNSGTSALHLAVMYAVVGACDEVITTANTLIATSEALLHRCDAGVCRHDPTTATIRP